MGIPKEEDCGAEIIIRQDLIDAVASVLVQFGEFSSNPSRNFESAQEAAQAVLELALVRLRDLEKLRRNLEVRDTFIVEKGLWDEFVSSLPTYGGDNASSISATGNGGRTDWTRYRMLDEGEIIQEGDEVLTDSHLGWQKAVHAIGQPAPDPYYTSHRMYRRFIVGGDKP